MAAFDKNFDPKKTVVAYCASGGRSALVAKTLKDMGYANGRPIALAQPRVTHRSRPRPRGD